MDFSSIVPSPAGEWGKFVTTLFNITACSHCNYSVTETSLKSQCSILKIPMMAK